MSACVGDLAAKPVMLRGLRAAGIAAPRLGVRRCSAGPTTKPAFEWWQLGVGVGGVVVSVGGVVVAACALKLQHEQSHGYIIEKAVGKILEPFVAPPDERGSYYAKKSVVIAMQILRSDIRILLNTPAEVFVMSPIAA